ncbi:hypothetical protein QJS10_CPB20g02124 [Acorus calamus]|uniref:RNase H type-1 domain-containing protein n=1 Tax=Acorus calamus TaxID=4465 RepID=A0AAV9CB33_ACOCL|nr:hypothetical protein QJS10_CPB20g02124 [Acorus calamus]
MARLVRWTPPPPHYVKCNVDASFKEWQDLDNEGGVGVIARDFRGEIIGCGHFYFRGVWLESSIHAECVALLRSIYYMISLNKRRIIFESDCMKVIDYIYGNCRVPRLVSGIIQRSLQLLRDQSIFDSWSVRHVVREANSVADHLARIAVDVKGWSMWSADYPPGVLERARVDISDSHVRVPRRWRRTQ